MSAQPLRTLLARLTEDEGRVEALRLGVRQGMLAQSETITEPQFTALSTADLVLLFRLYDQRFLENTVGAALAAPTGGPLSLRVSRRLTKTAGLTTHTRRRQGKYRQSFEICISSTLLFQTFGAGAGRGVEVCGCRAEDRLDALQRVFEHELVHLIELLATGTTQCSKPEFMDIARGLFDHQTNRHALVTPVETAQVRHGIAPGSLVRFEQGGAPQIGRVVRITRRATVLVPHEGGDYVLDGVRHQKFYVPLEALTVIPEGGGPGPRRTTDRPGPAGGF